MHYITSDPITSSLSMFWKNGLYHYHYGVGVSRCIYVFLLQFVFQNFLFFIRMSVGKENERDAILRKDIL